MSHVTSVNINRFNPKVQDDPNSITARRERAYQWYTRLGMPTYEKFQKTVKTTNLGDIKLEDIDLLPWATNDNGRRKVDRDAFKLMKAIESEGERKMHDSCATLDSSDSSTPVEYSQAAYNLYKRLAEPRKEVFQAVVTETVGVDFAQEDLDVDLLAWDETEQFVYEDKVQEENKVGEERRAQGIVDQDKDKIDARRLRTLEWYKRLQKPEKSSFHTVLIENTGLDLGKDEIDVDLLPWDPSGKFVVEDKLDDKIIEEQKKEQQELEEKRKEFEVKLRQEQIMEERIRAVKEKKRKEKEERKQREAEEAAQKQKEEEEENARKERMAAMKAMKSASKSVGKIFGKGEKTPTKSPKAPVRTKSSDSSRLLKVTTTPKDESPKRSIQRAKSEATGLMGRSSSKKLAPPPLADDEPEDVKTVRAHLLWGKWAQPAKKRYKEKIKEHPDCAVREEDVDLLPWNFNGTLVNAAKMGPMIRAVNSRGVKIDVNSHV